MKNKIIIGTRGSELALWQAQFVGQLLVREFPSLLVENKIIKTKGDKILNKPLELIGGKGLFTKELENELLNGKIDIAVHSLKDMPTVLPAGLNLLGVTKRGPASDVLVVRSNNFSLATLPPSAAVATGSLRRKAQLFYKRPDLRIADLRGNINTRVRKFMESDWHAMVLAKAGLERLGISNLIIKELPFDEMLPAVGQGALGIEGREDDAETIDLIKAIIDEKTQVCTEAERAFLKALGGGCKTPITAYCSFGDNDSLVLDGLVAATDGSVIIREKMIGHYDKPEMLGSLLAEELIQKGAKQLLKK